MNEILGNIYCLLEGLFGENMADYLWGYNCQTEAYDGQNLFNIIGLFSIIITIVFVLAYYYLPLYLFNHPRSNRRWNWLIILFVSGIVNFFYASTTLVNHFMDGRIEDCLMYSKDEPPIQLIYTSDCWMFGLVNFFWMSLLFVIVSVIVIFIGSRVSYISSNNCRHTPFKI